MESFSEDLSKELEKMKMKNQSESEDEDSFLYGCDAPYFYDDKQRNPERTNKIWPDVALEDLIKEYEYRLAHKEELEAQKAASLKIVYARALSSS